MVENFDFDLRSQFFAILLLKNLESKYGNTSYGILLGIFTRVVKKSLNLKKKSLNKINTFPYFCQIYIYK